MSICSITVLLRKVRFALAAVLQWAQQTDVFPVPSHSQVITYDSLVSDPMFYVPLSVLYVQASTLKLVVVINMNEYSERVRFELHI